MQSILISSPIVGRRLFEKEKLPQSATAEIRTEQNLDGTLVIGVGVRPDGKGPYFAEDKTNDPKKLWRGMFAATKLFDISCRSVALAMIIADDSVPLDATHEANARDCLESKYRSAAALRKEVLEQVIPPNELASIVHQLNAIKQVNNKPVEHISTRKGREFDTESVQLFLSLRSYLRNSSTRLAT